MLYNQIQCNETAHITPFFVVGDAPANVMFLNVISSPQNFHSVS